VVVYEWHSAPRVHGHADVALQTESTVQPVDRLQSPKGYVIWVVHLKTDGAAAKEQRVTGDNGSHGDAMAGMDGSSPKRRSSAQKMKKGHGKGRELTAS